RSTMSAGVVGRCPRRAAAPKVNQSPAARPVQRLPGAENPMRILFRSLVATAFVLAVAIGGASSTLAATPGSSENANGAQTGGDTISGSGCFDDVDFVYCTDMRGRMHLTSTPGAKDLATLDIVEDVTVFDASGNLFSSWKSVSHSKGFFGVD